jgi:hypothetical protein
MHTARARAARLQVRVFSDTDAAAALQGRDVWAAVTPCDAAAGLASRSTKLAMVVPASGTLLFADVWAQPRRAGGALHPAISQHACSSQHHRALPPGVQHAAVAPAAVQGACSTSLQVRAF